MDDKNSTNQSLHNKLDQLIGRLDVFQNMLESQNRERRARALDEKLVELSTQFEKEKSFSREPQNETQTVGLSPVQKAKLSDSGINSKPPLSDIIKEVRFRLKELDERTDLIKINLLGTCDEVSSSSISENLRGLKIVLAQVNTSIISLAERLETVETSWANVGQKIEKVETSLNEGLKTVKEDLISLKQGQDLVTTKIEQSTNEVKDDINRCKREIFAVTEKEPQIERNGIEEPLPYLGKYSFEFYVPNLTGSRRSGAAYNSPVWHIHEAETSMTGNVQFIGNGEIRAYLINAHPKDHVNFVPQKSLKVKVTICDLYNKDLPYFLVAERTVHPKNYVPVNNAWCLNVGFSADDDLYEKQYGQKEGYLRDTILVRFDFTVL